MGTGAARAHIVSSFTMARGALIPETYSVLAGWDFSLDRKNNLDRLRNGESLAATSGAWLDLLGKVMNRRFDPAGKDRALAILAKGGYPVDRWRAILLWHLTRDEFLLRDFLVNWLFPAFDAGAYRLRPSELNDFLASVESRGGTIEHEWSETTRDRIAAGLFKTACDFGLLQGRAVRTFPAYHLPDDAFVYVLHALSERPLAVVGMIQSPEWRMFLMRPEQIERTLLRLHQFKKLQYEVAGSLAQLTLPFPSALQYAESLVS